MYILLKSERGMECKLKKVEYERVKEKTKQALGKEEIVTKFKKNLREICSFHIFDLIST